MDYMEASHVCGLAIGNPPGLIYPPSLTLMCSQFVFAADH